MSNICLQEIQSIHDWWASFPFFLPSLSSIPPDFFPSDWKWKHIFVHQLHRRRWLQRWNFRPSLLASSLLNSAIITLSTSFSFRLSSSFNRDMWEEKVEGKCILFWLLLIVREGKWVQKTSPRIVDWIFSVLVCYVRSLLWCYEIITPTNSKVLSATFSYFLPPSQPHQHHPRHQHDFVFKESRMSDKRWWVDDKCLFLASEAISSVDQRPLAFLHCLPRPKHQIMERWYSNGPSSDIIITFNFNRDRSPG